LNSKRSKLGLLLSQSCLLSTTFWPIHFPSTNSSNSTHLRLFAMLQCARALQCQEGTRHALFQISCYLGCSVVVCFVLLLFVFYAFICVVLFLFVLFCCYLCCFVVIYVVL